MLPASYADRTLSGITEHAIELTGLTPGTTYYLVASNRHAIDGGDLASAVGQFTTAALTTRAKDQGKAVAGASVCFAVDATSGGSGTLSSTSVNTDVGGVATARFAPTRSGLVKISVPTPVTTRVFNIRSDLAAGPSGARR